MPNRNQLGPEGIGPHTGRGMGGCLEGKMDNSNASISFQSRCGHGRHLRGCHRTDFRHRCGEPLSLEEERKWLQSRLNQIDTLLVAK